MFNFSDVEYPQDLLNGITSAPGRVRSYIKQLREKREIKLLPHSCRLSYYNPEDLFKLLVYTSRDLRGGSGVKLILDLFKKFEPLSFNWKFYLDAEHPDFNKITEHQRKFLSTTAMDYGRNFVIKVQDSMEGEVEFVSPAFVNCSIEDSWKYFIIAAKRGEDILVDLSNLRPNGSTNALGLTATGAVGDGSRESDQSSFLAIYEMLANHLIKGDILSFLQLFGVLNGTLRRGGLFKNGIVTSSMRYDNPNFEDYLNAPLTEIPGSHKKGVRINEGIFNNPTLTALVVEKRNTESVFLEKIDDSTPDIFLNVCVTGDTWVNTSEGAKQVKDLVGKKFSAVVHNSTYSSTDRGFWSNGIKEVVKVTFDNNRDLTLTPNHKLYAAVETEYPVIGSELSLVWTEVEKLKAGDAVLDDTGLLATIQSIVPAGSEEVYDCTIEEVHCFSANGILAHNCVGIELNPGGTCLIWRVNLAQCEVSDIPEAFKMATLYLCKLHTEWRSQVGSKADIYRPLEEDRQIGLDIMGFPTLLMNEGVTFREFRDALKYFLHENDSNSFECPENISPDAWKIVSQLVMGYTVSTFVADCYMDSKGLPRLDRIHTCEPAQNHSFEIKDKNGFTSTRGIFPPFDRKVRRRSDSQKTKIFNHGSVETLVEVGNDVYWEVLELWQEMMNRYGRPHAISSDTIVECTEDWLKNFVINSPLKSAYYNFTGEFDQAYLKKVANIAGEMSEEALICSIENPGSCSACEE